MGKLIIPSEIKEQAREQIQALRDDSSNIQAVLSNIDELESSSDLQGKAWDSIKEQFGAHRSVVLGTVCTNEYMIEDNQTLMQVVGDTELDEDEIRSDIRVQEMAKISYERRAADCQSKVNRLRSSQEQITAMAMIGYYKAQIRQYTTMADQAEAAIRELNEKLDDMDEIIYQSSGLFEEAEELYKTVKRGIADLEKSWTGSGFKVPTNTSWRSTLEQAWADYMEKRSEILASIMSTDEAGNVIIDWGKLEQILGKDAEYITDAEYYAIAMLYTMMDNDDLTDFFLLLMDKVGDVSNPVAVNGFLSLAGQDGKDYSEWAVNVDKLNRILGYTKEFSDTEMKQMKISLQNNKDFDDDRYNKITQRITLIEVMQSIEVVRGKYEESSPILNIAYDSEMGALTIKFAEWRTIGSLKGERQDSSLGYSTVTINRPVTGNALRNESIEKTELVILDRLGPHSDLEAGQFIGETLMDIYQDHVLNMGSIAVGFIKREVDYNAIESQFESLKEINLYADLNCTGMLSNYDTMQYSKDSTYIVPTPDTEIRIAALNKELGTNITFQKIVTDPESVFGELNKAKQNNPDFDKIYNNATQLSYKHDYKEYQ